MIVLLFSIETNDFIAHATDVKRAFWRIGRMAYEEVERTRSQGQKSIKEEK